MVADHAGRSLGPHIFSAQIICRSFTAFR